MLPGMDVTPGPIEELHLPGPPGLAVSRAAGGDGTPALLLHGIGGNRRNWHDQLGAFARSRSAWAPDLRGYGDSESHPGPTPLAFEDLVADAARVLAAMGAPAHVLGLSMGGLVAQALAARHPARVRSLTLVACRPGDAPVLPGERGEAFLRDRLGPIERGGPEALAASLIPALTGPNASDAARAALRDSILRLRVPDYVAVLRARSAMAPVADPRRLALPVLVLGGGADRLAPPAQMQALAAAIPGARLAILDGAGYLLNLEAPDAFRDAVTRFWEEVG
ncbi:MAG: alpha/beta fold hydrolase [Acetobacteraceae bacterium]|nr:alpha/beta fold hydrolase [Acetobacteraceae bacterium]